MTLTPDQITAVVLAGGFGTRIKHLLRDLPKPMAPVEGKPFVEWVVRYLGRQGIRQVVISTGYLAETIEDHFKSQPVPDVTVQCVPETTPLGTAGGFLNAARASGQNPQAWLALNGDSMAPAPLAGMIGSLADPAIAGAILGVPMPDASRYGTLEHHPDGTIARFHEKRPGSGTINAGVYLFRNRTVAGFPDRFPLSFETDVFPALTAGGARLKVFVTETPFLDIGTPESLPQAGEFIRRCGHCF